MPVSPTMPVSSHHKKGGHSEQVILDGSQGRYLFGAERRGPPAFPGCQQVDGRLRSWPTVANRGTDVLSKSPSAPLYPHSARGDDNLSPPCEGGVRGGFRPGSIVSDGFSTESPGVVFGLILRAEDSDSRSHNQKKDSRPLISPGPGGRPAVRPGPRNGVGGVWRPAPNSRQVEIGKLFPARSLTRCQLVLSSLGAFLAA